MFVIRYQLTKVKCVHVKCMRSGLILKSLSFYLPILWCTFVHIHTILLCESMLYPYSTQATNRPNRHELFFFLFGGGGGGGGGIRKVSLFFFSNCDELRVIPDSDRMSLRILVGIGSIRLESRKNSLRLENNIRTCCTEVKESITNQLRICGMQHELGTN